MFRNRRALIIGDSMAMPRLGVHYDQTWPCKLVHNFPNIEFIDKSRRASTSERLVSDGAGAGDSVRSADLLEYYSPDFVITQVGITDCAPRLFKRRGFLSYVFHFSPQCVTDQLIKLLKRYRGRKEKYAYVSPELFRSNWAQYFERCRNYHVQVFCILIGLPAREFILKSPNILTSITKYNLILERLANEYENVHCITPFSQNEIEEIALDEFHVDAIGHSIIADKLIREIDTFYKFSAQ